MPDDSNAAAPAMTYEFIAFDRRDAIAILRLNRPDNLNSWNLAMRQELRDAVQSCVEDDELRVLIITGTGRAFSAGEDVRGMGDLSAVGPKGFRRRVRMIHNVFDEIEQMEIPVIAAINGVAAGGGLELALSCDFRFAADSAKMGLPENNVGLIPGSGGISRLVKLVGPSKAKRLVMTGEIVPAEKALAYGLVDEVVPADDLIDHALAFAEQLAAKAPLALGTAKLVINQCANVDLETGRNFERIGQSVLKLSEDHVEGAKAFVEKRKPDFKGR
ncbi:MAG: enoyl-CoA hydratase/isomerase family protein [Alphaproteobacteria bacterium]|nr:enoyl-CoA hydratase/isomerase family protein [Alphaproteobacteria bacterium]